MTLEGKNTKPRRSRNSLMQHDNMMFLFNFPLSCFFAIIQASKDGWSAINFHQCVGEMRDDDDDVFIRIAFGLYIQNTHSNHMNMIMLTKKKTGEAQL